MGSALGLKACLLSQKRQAHERTILVVPKELLGRTAKAQVLRHRPKDPKSEIFHHELPFPLEGKVPERS
jgi:hypothetical protein